MRIVSLLPAATEMVYLLSLQKLLVGVSKDSDFPRQVSQMPKLTESVISNKLSSREIDKKVKEFKHRGQSVFHIKKGLLKKLNPEIILTQELCPVCAPSFTDVRKACKVLEKSYFLISLEPHKVGDIFDNIKTIASYTGVEDIAKQKIKNLKKRISEVQEKSYGQKKKSVLVIEWLDPIMVAGHWVPEMVKLAGGISLLAKKGEKSKRIFWKNIILLDPDILIIAPCGFDIQRTKKEMNLITERSGFKNLKAHKNRNVYLVDGDSFLTRPGPRIVDGVEIFSQILHPNLFKRKYPKLAWQNLFEN